MKDRKTRVCFAASSGGHLSELMLLRPLMDRYDSFLVTEKTGYRAVPEELRCYRLLQVNRREWSCVPRLIVNAFLALNIYFRERPDAVICTGVLATVPLCLLCKLFGKRLVFIESYAKVKTPTLPGRRLRPFADRFYVQWEELLEVYPKAIYVGGIY